MEDEKCLKCGLTREQHKVVDKKDFSDDIEVCEEFEGQSDLRTVFINGEKIYYFMDKLSTFRKRPVKVHAIKINVAFEVKTMEGLMKGKPGDFLIFGIKGEAYPCDLAIFNETYDIDNLPIQAIFKCHKCEHLVYIAREKFQDIVKMDCPECGEEPDNNWVLQRLGDYEEDSKKGKIKAN